MKPRNAGSGNVIWLPAGLVERFGSAAEFVELLRAASLRQRDDDVVWLKRAKAAVKSFGRRQVEGRRSADGKKMRPSGGDIAGGAAARDERLPRHHCEKSCDFQEALIEGAERRVNRPCVRFDHGTRHSQKLCLVHA